MAKLFPLIFAFVLYSISQFSLWNISQYLSHNPLQAYLLFPTGLRLAVYLLARPSHAWIWLLSDMLLAGAILVLLPDQSSPLMLLMPWLVWLAAAIARQHWPKLHLYWQKLLLIVALVLLHTILVGFTFTLLAKPLQMGAETLIAVSIASLTGGIVLTPFLYLVADYLSHQTWHPLSPQLIHHDVKLKPKMLVWSLLFFSLGLLAELTLLEQMKPFALLIILLPTIFLAYRYGWQGGVLASSLNCILLATARQFSGSFSSDQELLIFMSSQAFVGLGLGIAISRQHQLALLLQKMNTRLAKELREKQDLARQLVSVEEQIRKSVARELHDEIGQNITAIQIQSMLAERLASNNQAKQAASSVQSLAMRIHQSTRQLLKQLRPHILDELGLEHAIRQLVQEMRFAEQGMTVRLNMGVNPQKLDDTTRVTLYRIVQELLNNISKHAKATLVHISLFPGSEMVLEVKDDGIGLPTDWRVRGQGLKGLSERVSALGGQLKMTSSTFQTGTRIIVNLPTKRSITSEKLGNIPR
ncbi:TPA: signal transduction histidine-protein kinase/phosphatase UhpB [Vibrio cholerae]|nr:signal transduction histidine-protein kinase/phosphatase UhpB [Vibrio cholerae]HDZ3748860.1 signal transduction histidine-protein kinase/phosphatase UhpB [Vibrio cholerae]HDZ3759735.1 signal transduction histidine-protein kinase/phosphatase UhpB [Vibrio cholerae]HDZ3773749.1 signal transduction histidine-protein kinase/phosphatase UhpB [Vibrio cholerae]